MFLCVSYPVPTKNYRLYTIDRCSLAIVVFLSECQSQGSPSEPAEEDTVPTNTKLGLQESCKGTTLKNIDLQVNLHPYLHYEFWIVTN